MLPKIAHVIVTGLSESRYRELDEMTRVILRHSDPAWEYASSLCESLEAAATKALGMEHIDIIYIGTSRGLAEDYRVLKPVWEKHLEMGVTYPDPPRNKLAIAIFAR